MNYSLFQATGVELEYMIVSQDNGCVLPLASQLLPVKEGTPPATDLDDRNMGCGIHASNELAAHVIEIKTCPPVTDLTKSTAPIMQAVSLLNKELSSQGACLCPSGMHPFMNPAVEGTLWPHGCGDIYQTYNHIFGCHGHGWLNLQSAHLNFPFSSDEEFGLLHAAIIILLPVLPALTASTPYCEGKTTGVLNSRLSIYAENQRICPEIAGQIVPEPALTQAEYEREILQPAYRAIAPYDKEGLLQEEWLNSRGAIARFDRGAIEIRVLDIQECPRMDISIACLIRNSLIALTRLGMEELVKLIKSDSHQNRVEQYKAVVQQGLNASLQQSSLQRLCGNASTVAEWWNSWVSQLQLPEFIEDEIQFILRNGSLAERMLQFSGQQPKREELIDLVRKLSRHLAENTRFAPV